MFVISTPSSRMVPSVGCSNPAISRSVVVFPQPEGPSSEKNSPLSTVRSIWSTATSVKRFVRSEEHTSELQSQSNLVCRLLLEKKKQHITPQHRPPKPRRPPRQRPHDPTRTPPPS